MGTNGDTCSVGDAVEVASDGGFWVARLTSLKLPQRECTVCWFYSQDEVGAKARPPKDLAWNEIFWSEHEDPISCDCIERRVRVLLLAGDHRGD